MRDAYFAYRGYMQQTYDDFPKNAAGNVLFADLVTNCRRNVHKCTETGFSYRSHPFETINMKIEQNIAGLIIRGSSQ